MKNKIRYKHNTEFNIMSKTTDNDVNVRLIEKINQVEENYEQKCAEINRRYDELVDSYSFETGIRRLIRTVESVKGR